MNYLPSAFIPKALIRLQQAGLLTCSLLDGLPIPSLETVAFKVIEKCEKSLQQRVLFPIFTGFPIMTLFRYGTQCAGCGGKNRFFLEMGGKTLIQVLNFYVNLPNAINALFLSHLNE